MRRDDVMKQKEEDEEFKIWFHFQGNGKPQAGYSYDAGAGQAVKMLIISPRPWNLRVQQQQKINNSVISDSSICIG